MVVVCVCVCVMWGVCGGVGGGVGGGGWGLGVVVGGRLDLNVGAQLESPGASG